MRKSIKAISVLMSVIIAVSICVPIGYAYNAEPAFFCESIAESDTESDDISLSDTDAEIISDSSNIEIITGEKGAGGAGASFTRALAWIFNKIFGKAVNYIIRYLIA